MKILHSADWHLDSPFASFSEEQRRQLRRAQQSMPGKVADLCLQEHCDLVLLSGDLFDGAASRETVARLQQELARCGVPVFVSPGNHDFCVPGSPWLEEKWPENVHVFTGAIESVVLKDLDCRVWGAGFTSMDCPGLLEGFQAEGTETYALGVFHGDPVQPGSPYNPITAAQVRDSGLDYLALGHIHKAGSFRAGAALCGWPGCPMGRGWDETGGKGVYLISLEPESAEIRRVSLGLPCFFEHTLDVERETLQDLLPPVETADFYRITLVGQGNVDISERKKEFAHVPNLELRDRREAPLDIWGNADADTLEGIYFRMLRDRLESTDPENARKIRLAAELSRRILVGREVRL